MKNNNKTKDKFKKEQLGDTKNIKKFNMKCGVRKKKRESKRII